MISSNSPAEVTIISKAFLPCPLSCWATSLPQLWSLCFLVSLGFHVCRRPSPCSCPRGILGPSSPPAQSTMGSKCSSKGFPGGSVVKNLPAKAGGGGSIPDLGRSHRPWSNNCWTCALEPGSRNRWVHVLRLLKPEGPRACAPPREKPLPRAAHTTGE